MHGTQENAPAPEPRIRNRLLYDKPMQTTSRTFTLIKPNAVAAGATGKILDRLIADGFRIRALKMDFLSRNRAARFYAVHRGKPFFEDLVRFMTSGAVVAAVLERDGERAVEALRTLVGATDPARAAAGTIRREFGESVTRNAIHASDSLENAREEWSRFFTPDEITEIDYTPEV